MLTTTLTEIEKHKLWEDKWEKLLKGLGDEYDREAPLPLERILEINDLDDALRALRAIKGYGNAIRLYDCYCAKYSLDIFEHEHPDDKRPRQAIETAERFAHGEATNEELAAARAAALAAARIVLGAAARAAGEAAARAAERDAVGAAAWDAIAAWAAAWDAAWAAVRDTAGGGPLALAAWDVVRDAAWDAAWAAARDDLQKEFIRLCRLEGEYGEVTG